MKIQAVCADGIVRYLHEGAIHHELWWQSLKDEATGFETMRFFMHVKPKLFVEISEMAWKNFYLRRELRAHETVD